MSNMKNYTPAEVQKILQEQAKLTAELRKGGDRRVDQIYRNEIKRKIPVEDYLDLMLEYWDRDTPRPEGFYKTVAKRYGALGNAIEKIVLNGYNTLSDDDYKKLMKPYNDKFGRSIVMKRQHKSGARKNVGKKISLTKNTVSPEDAVEIYNKSFASKEGRKHKYYHQLAKEYNVSFNKIQGVVNGIHPALQHLDVKADVRAHEIKYLGIYEFTSPEGVVHTFDNLYDVGAWLWKTEHNITDKTSQENWSKGRMWFEQSKPNVLYTKRRRFWKGWSFINKIPVDKDHE